MSSLIFLTGQLAKRREQLIRLKSAAIQLEAVYEKFITKQKKITEPTLHRKLWYGELASDFEQFRTVKIGWNYKTIYQKQLKRNLEAIDTKIKTLEIEIASFEQRIQAERRRMQKQY